MSLCHFFPNEKISLIIIQDCMCTCSRHLAVLYYLLLHFCVNTAILKHTTVFRKYFISFFYFQMFRWDVLIYACMMHVLLNKYVTRLIFTLSTPQCMHFVILYINKFVSSLKTKFKCIWSGLNYTELLLAFL